MEVDYDSAIRTMQQIVNGEQIGKMNKDELQVITYCVVYYMQNEEFSLRDTALHTLKTILIIIKDQPDTYHTLLSIIEK